MAPAHCLVVLIIAAVCLGTSDAKPLFVAPALRYASVTKWNISSAAAAGLNYSTMVAHELAGVEACIAGMPKGSVMKGMVGSALNENFFNCSSTPEWGSYAKVIDFKDITAQKMYVACQATNNTATSNALYVAQKYRFITHANAADISIGFPASPVVLLSLNNASAGSNATSIQAVIDARTALLSGVSSLCHMFSVKAWLPKYAGANFMTNMAFISFNSPQSAVAYKAYKAGNAPGNVPPLPLFVTIKTLVTPNKDLEFAPIFVKGNY